MHQVVFVTKQNQKIKDRAKCEHLNGGNHWDACIDALKNVY